jgi:hypothetical protein
MKQNILKMLLFIRLRWNTQQLVAAKIQLGWAAGSFILGLKRKDIALL